MSKALSVRKMLKLVVLSFLIFSLAVTQYGLSFASGSMDTGALTHSSLKKLDAETFSMYIATLVKAHKDEIEASIINDNFDQFSINEVKFDINSGLLRINFSSHYTDKILGIPIRVSFTGVISAQLVISNDYSNPGICLKRLESIDISRCPAFVDKLIRDYLNKKFANTVFWMGEKSYSDYMVFDIKNIKNIIQGIIKNKISDMSIKVNLPGGTVSVLFSSVLFKELSIEAGRTAVDTVLALDVNLLSGKSARFDKFCNIEIDADLFIDSTDNNWWVGLNKNLITINDVHEGVNIEANSSIEKELVRVFGPEKLIKLGGDINISSSYDFSSGVSPVDASAPQSLEAGTIQPPVTTSGEKKAEIPEVIEKNTLSRTDDPVVLTGADVPSLKGLNPGEIVAFSYDKGWRQVPMQIDERANVSLAKVYNASEKILILFELLGRKDVSILTYTDPNTFTSGDPDQTLDDDDEIVFMSKDAGGTPDVFSEPAGAVPGTGVRISIADPLNAEGYGCIYFFKQDGTLEQSAGKKYVNYNFNLLSGDYKATYKTGGGPNKESSTVTTPYYSQHFSDRWIEDEIHILKGNSSGVDILDRHKALFKPGVSTRTEDTFCNGAVTGFPAEGCYIANIAGPIRAIRSYLGANSGFLTQRENIFYESREDVNTCLRVHPISGIVDFYDYSPAAEGMVYSNDLNKSGVTVDGVPDSLIQGPIQWELLSGSQGSLAMIHKIETNIPDLAYTSYYLDNKNPQDPVEAQFTGDPYAYGSSGLWFDKAIQNTDPSSGPAYDMTLRRYIYFQSPGFSQQNTEEYSRQLKVPLCFTVQPYMN